MASMHTYPGIKTPWLLTLRLLTFCLVSGIVVGWLRVPSYLQVPFFAYCFVTLATLITLLLFQKFNLHFLYRVLITLHFAAEILNEVGIVYTTGSLYSPFSALFLLTIVSAAMVYRLVGTLLVASFVSLTYAGVAWMNAYLLAPGSNTIPSGGRGNYTADDILFYSTFLHILIFYLVAFIAGYLAEKLQTKDKELDSASAELRKARLETGDILRHLNCGLITIDSAGIVVYFNRAAECILGVEETAVSGRHCREVFTERLAPLADNLLSVLKSERLISRSEFELATEDERTVPVGISTSVLQNENSGVRGVIAIFQDLTESKRLEEKIRQADRMAAVGELSAYIAHEIRNPLASISGAVEVLRSDLPVEGDNRKLMSLIIKEASRLNNVLSDFLLYARVRRPRFHKVELNRVLTDVIELMRRHPAYHESIKIEFFAETNVTYISADEDQLKQLLLNLAVNACEAMESDVGLIRWEISSEEDTAGDCGVWLSIRDTGPGIDGEQMDKIFLPFYSTRKGGTGLGLAIVSRLVEALDGKIEVSSECGRGTEFRLRFRGLRRETPSLSPQAGPPIPHAR